MCSSLVAAYSDAVGVCRVTSQVCFLARASRSACRAGSYLAIAWATTVSTAFAPQRCSRGAICWSTHPAASRERVWVRTATWRPFQAGTSRVATRFQVSGRRWRSSRASVISCLAVTGETPQGDGEGFGGVGGDLGAALPAERLVGQQCFAAPGGDTGLGGGGMHDGPLVGDQQLVAGGGAFALVGVGEEVEQRRRGRGRRRPESSCAASVMGLVKQGPPTVARRRKPLFHRGSEHLRWSWPPVVSMTGLAVAPQPTAEAARGGWDAPGAT